MVKRAIFDETGANQAKFRSYDGDWYTENSGATCMVVYLRYSIQFNSIQTYSFILEYKMGELHIKMVDVTLVTFDRI